MNHTDTPFGGLPPVPGSDPAVPLVIPKAPKRPDVKKPDDRGLLERMKRGHRPEHLDRLEAQYVLTRHILP